MILVDVKFSSIRDSFGDTSRIILIGKEIKDEQRFIETFILSEKAVSVLSQLIDGKKIAEIAESMGIALRTVKSHSSHIYSKLNVRNKMELFRLLETYKLIPEKAAAVVTSFPLLRKNIEK